ncbi:MAG: manganese efflux pump MntP family protein [Kofleriaceae bacterium]|nr:manganese efflux pump MntP family protein [Kofleriaceae bacterium]
MDATAVAAARGVVRRSREGIVLPTLFGVFQAAMAALGWLIGTYGVAYVERLDHWVAFVLLVGIGLKMLYEALRGADDAEGEPGTGVGLYLALAVATSIDAAAAGLTLPLVPVASWIALSLIGVVTLGCSALGYQLGHRLGAKLGKPLEIAGGIVLIALGTRVLIQHL